MIYVGLTGWGDHDQLYTDQTRAIDKLSTYASFFPTVEVDSTYYAVQPHSTWQKWMDETPDNFRFIVKAYAGMTGQLQEKPPFESEAVMFQAFKESLHPVMQSGKLAMVLCQYPPWFDCTKENVQTLRQMRTYLDGLPVAVEFRHQSWYEEHYRQKTIQFLSEHQFIHSVCDEPQAGVGSIPIVPIATTKGKTLIRLHGRNRAGWRKETAGANWRKVRYLYDYNLEEIDQWINHAEQLHAQSEDIYVIFNNNSGGHASDNARTYMERANLSYEGLAPKQLSLFSEEER